MLVKGCSISSSPTINFNFLLKTKVEIGIGTSQKLLLEKLLDEWDFLEMIS
jgi:hypothetical protein